MQGPVRGKEKSGKIPKFVQFIYFADFAETTGLPGRNFSYLVLLWLGIEELKS
jgi:hypothetical protein